MPPLGDVLRPFRRVKRRRGPGDYAGSEDQFHPDDIHADLPAAAVIVEAAERILPHSPCSFPPLTLIVEVRPPQVRPKSVPKGPGPSAFRGFARAV